MQMRYRYTPYDFTLENVPLISGALTSIVKSQDISVGALFDEIAKLLKNTPGVFAGREWFTLVNVTNDHSNFSFGVCDTPPKDALPLACTWYFTFAYSAGRYSNIDKIDHRSLRGINAIAWKDNGNSFITIGISHVLSQKLGLKYDMLTPRYVYFLLGCLTKSFITNHKWYLDNRDYSRSYAGLFLPSVKASIYMKTLANVLNRTPYNLWVFNRHVWLTAPNLLNEKHITSKSLLYILKYIDTEVVPEYLEDRIVDLLDDSLHSFIRRRKSNTTAKNLDECLFSALVFRDILPNNVEFNDWLVEKDQVLMLLSTDISGNTKDFVRKLFHREITYGI